MNSNDPTTTAILFEFYVKAIWPFQRIFVKSKFSKRCKLCAASEKMIPLNNQMICKTCENQVRITHVDRSEDLDLNTELNKVISTYAGKSVGKYDVLILFSGGKDSCYMVKRLTSENPQLRILAYTIDNGFMSPIAKKNIDEVLPKLNIDHIFVKPKASFYFNLFRFSLCHLNEDGCYGTVDFSDGEFMLDSAKKFAQAHHIPIIVCGYSKYQVQNGLKFESFEFPQSLLRAPRKDVAGNPLSAIFKGDDLQMWWNEENSENSFQPRLLFPLYAWNLQEEYIKEKVVEWRLISKKEQSPIVTNHRLIPLLGVVDVHQKGYSSFEPEFCRMIREGKAELKIWQHTFEFLEYTARTGFLVRPVVKKLLHDLNLDLTDVKIVF